MPGIKEREGDIRAKTMSDAKKETLCAAVTENVESVSIVSTEKFVSHGLLALDGYKHNVVKDGANEFGYYDKRHDARRHTNQVESFCNLLEAYILSTYTHASKEYMDHHQSEFPGRSNRRQIEDAIYDLLIRLSLMTLTNVVRSAATLAGPIPRTYAYAHTVIQTARCYGFGQR